VFLSRHISLEGVFLGTERTLESGDPTHMAARTEATLAALPDLSLKKAERVSEPH
jgi:hypothetical protein